MKRTFFVLNFILLAFLSLSAQDTTQMLNEAGFELPRKPMESIDFELENLEGKTESLSDYLGKVVFLNFWATWCGPCRIEMPSMESLYSDMKDDGLVILGINLRETREQVNDFRNKYGLTFPLLLDRRSEVGLMYGASAIPTTYIIDRGGMIIARTVGAREWYTDEIIKLFSKILEED